MMTHQELQKRHEVIEKLSERALACDSIEDAAAIISILEGLRGVPEASVLSVIRLYVIERMHHGFCAQGAFHA
jgi:hypothetical protein